MTLNLVCGARGNIIDPETRPEFRRATRNMRICAAAMGAIFENQPSLDRARLGVILGTSLGELETTTEFMTTIAKQNIARPLLFQNSLHNATLGFLTLHFGITGPSATVSNRENSPGDTIDLAATWLNDGMAAEVLILSTDTRVGSMPHASAIDDHAYALLVSANPQRAAAHLDILENPAAKADGGVQNTVQDIVLRLEASPRPARLTLQRPLRGNGRLAAP